MNEQTRAQKLDMQNAVAHCRALCRLARAVARRNRFWIQGWRRYMRTRGWDDILC